MHPVKIADSRFSDLPIWLITIIAIVVALSLGREFLLPVAVAVILAMVLQIPLNGLQKLKVPRWIAIIFLTTSVGATAWLLISLLTEPMQYFIANHETIMSDVRTKLIRIQITLNEAQEVGSAITSMGAEVARPISNEDAQEVIVKESNFLVETASSIVSSLTTVLATLIICGFILSTPRPFTTFVTMLHRKPSSKLFAARMWRSVERHISYYFFVTTIINAGLGLVVGLCLYALEIPMPVFWGVVVAILNYMPFIGPAIGTIILSAFCLLNFDDVWSIVLPPILYLFVNFVEANFVTPNLVGRKTEIPPLAIVLSLFFWGWLWGFIGLFLAIPILVIVKAVSVHIDPLSTIHQMLTPRRLCRGEQ